MPPDVRKAFGLPAIYGEIPGYAHSLGPAQIGVTAQRKREALPHIRRHSRTRGHRTF